MQKPKVSVIVPSFYRHPYIKEVLHTLSLQTHPVYEVVVPDQTPLHDVPDGFYQAIQERLPLKVIHVEEPNISAPRNLAARTATGDILLFLDDDVLISENLVAAHLAVMHDENVDVVNGAVCLQKTLPDAYPWDVRNMDPVRFFLAAPNHHWQGMMLGVSSCNFSIKKEVFLKVGGFDEKLPRMVDFELGYRLFRAGAKIHFTDKAFAQHLRAPGGSRQNPRNHNKLVAALYIHRKHFPGWITTQFKLKMSIAPLFRRWSFRTPFKVALGTYRVIRASAKVNKLLGPAKKGIPVIVDSEHKSGNLALNQAA